MKSLMDTIRQGGPGVPRVQLEDPAQGAKKGREGGTSFTPRATCKQVTQSHHKADVSPTAHRLAGHSKLFPWPLPTYVQTCSLVSRPWVQSLCPE